VKKSGPSKPTKASRYFDIKTFTYFIAAPPRRKTGYREREFDKIMQGLLNSGVDVIEWKAQAVEGGVYVIFLLGSTKKSAVGALLDVQEKFGLNEKHSSKDLEFIEHEDD
jgi:hypothetical protein